ncbi:receptor-type tyrosine-protein phosphatase R [Xiphophorus maculatus]|nr:receptor-type tyrosine-protein phosphatase R [Xiphophorus maculatus]XP_023206351.1 receptor-type tyrosine-protein phosphatase R [Xiphophorus maculatus]
MNRSRRRGEGGFTMFFSLCLIWTQLLIPEYFAGGPFPTHRPGRHTLITQRDANELPESRSHLHLHRHHHQHQNQNQNQNQYRLARPESRLQHKLGARQSLDLLEQLHQDVEPDHFGWRVVPGEYVVTMYLAVGVRRLNISHLLWFRDGVAASLGIAPQHVHINKLNARNGIELFVSSERRDIFELRPAKEIVQSLNRSVLHHHLADFGITAVKPECCRNIPDSSPSSPKKNVLQDDQRDHARSRDGLYNVVLFFTFFLIITTCLMVLYRMKQKVPVTEKQLKAPPPDHVVSLTLPPDPHKRSKGTKVVTSESMVQSELPPAVATPIHQQQPIRACRRLAPPVVPLPSPVPIINTDSHTPPTSVPSVTSANELKPCPSPFRMKPAAGLQERRGSNVSLVLDMSALGSVEPLNVSVVTPREAAAREYLLSAGRPLTRQQLRDVVSNTHKLHVEFAEIPMNFIDPKELDIPNHGTKNRYKTILPNPHSRVILKSKSCNDLLSSYINANYIRGYLGDSRAFIATQGPMVNTVNDFWQMVWQEESPVIVMITKLKEKNEKCVLYWPEKRGIYGKVEVLVNGIRECEHYATRSLTLKCGNQTRVLQHYWYTSWPDHKTPDSALPLLQLMADVEAERRTAACVGPVIVHCSAGIGRTGCFIATTTGCRQLQVEGVVDVLNITCQLRADRGGMIQTGEQYEFVHHALSLFEARLSAESGQ